MYVNSAPVYSRLTTSCAGGLALLVAESKKEARTLFAGVPSLGENKPKTYLMLGGRILLVFMFLTLIRLEFSMMQVGPCLSLIRLEFSMMQVGHMPHPHLARVFKDHQFCLVLLLGSF